MKSALYSNNIPCHLLSIKTYIIILRYQENHLNCFDLATQYIFSYSTLILQHYYCICSAFMIEKQLFTDNVTRKKWIHVDNSFIVMNVQTPHVK